MNHYHSYKLALVVCFVCLFVNKITAQVNELYKPLHGGSFSAAGIAASPDPLIRYKWNDPKANDSLQFYTLQPKKISAVPSTSFKTTAKEITVTGKGNLLFDFGTESAGWLEFESDDLVDSVEMSISEYNEPAVLNAGAQYPVKTRKPEKYGNIYRLELNTELYEGVRFGWIHVNHFTKPWHIKNIRLVCQVKPVNYNGSFYCNDTMLNRIWYTGAYVVKLNMLQNFLGAILMERSDRHSWTGDAYPAQAAALAAFGNYDIVKKNIAFTSNQDNGIASYSIYWVLSLIDYYNYTGDADFLKQYAANAAKRLQKAYDEYDALPQLAFMGWDERLGAGFENPQIEESENTYRMLCINGWKQFAKAMHSVNENAVAEKYQHYADEKIKQLKESSIDHYGIHAISEAINAGLMNDANVNRVSQKLFADRLNRLSYSAFNQCFIIQAMALAKQNTLALATIKDTWGGQIKYGGTSFFEVYRPSWNEILKNNDAPPNNQCGYTSLAHPWGAGVTQWLSENILGIQPITAGFKTFSVIPFLQNELTEVKGTMPTPYGNITASFNTVSGNCTINIPKETVAEKIGLPKNGRQIDQIFINNKIFWGKGASANSIEADSNYVYLQNFLPGNYKIKIIYKGIRNNPTIIKESYNYSIHSFEQDSTTSGNWKSKYGKEGYMFLGNSTTMQKLPAYIDSIKLKKNSSVVWDSTGNDVRTVQAPSGNKLAAAIITRDPEACNQTMTIDVYANKDQPFKLSLYLLDYDKKERRSAIEIFDLKTLNILAPVQMVRNYEKGKYISFTAIQAIRIRINQVRGKNAAVSGIFFDQP